MLLSHRWSFKVTIKAFSLHNKAGNLKLTVPAFDLFVKNVIRSDSFLCFWTLNCLLHFEGHSVVLEKLPNKSEYLVNQVSRFRLIRAIVFPDSAQTLYPCVHFFPDRITQAFIQVFEHSIDELVDRRRRRFNLHCTFRPRMVNFKIIITQPGKYAPSEFFVFLTDNLVSFLVVKSCSPSLFDIFNPVFLLNHILKTCRSTTSTLCHWTQGLQNSRCLAGLLPLFIELMFSFFHACQ